MEQWFESENIHPNVVGEFKDRALMTTFGQAGVGVLAAPAAIEKEIRDHHGLVRIGGIESIAEHYYAISIERKLKHPAVVTISEAARERLFAVHSKRQG